MVDPIFTPALVASICMGILTNGPTVVKALLDLKDSYKAVDKSIALLTAKVRAVITTARIISKWIAGEMTRPPPDVETGLNIQLSIQACSLEIENIQKELKKIEDRASKTGFFGRRSKATYVWKENSIKGYSAMLSEHIEALDHQLLTHVVTATENTMSPGLRDVPEASQSSGSDKTSLEAEVEDTTTFRYVVNPYPPTEPASNTGWLAKIWSTLLTVNETEVAVRAQSEALLAASSLGDVPRMEDLIRTDARVRHKSGHGETALHHAAHNDRLEAVKFLLSKGALINAVCDKGQTALHCAVLASADVAIFLINKGASVDTVANNSHTPLCDAIIWDQLDIVKCLIDKGADVNKIACRQSRRPLHIAVSLGRLDIAEFLLDNGANANIQEDHGHTPLYLVVARDMWWEQELKMIEMLIRKRADPDISCNDGSTPLHVAAEKRKDAQCRIIFNRLIEAGAEVDAVNNLGETPIQISERLGKHRAVRKLLKHGAK